jgi:hypothetical protein
MIISLFSNKLSTDKLNKVQQVAKDLNFNTNWLLAVMYFETAKTFNPAIKNGIGSVGLIQFTRDKSGVNYKTINGKRYLLDDIAKMSFIQQMDLVKEYYKEIIRMLKINRVNSFIDLYLLTFFPRAVNQPLNYVFETSGLSASKIASQNPSFDKNKDQKITKNEVSEHFQKYYNLVFNEINSSDIQNVSSTFDKICTYCKQALPIVLPIAVFFYTIVTIII